MTNQTVRGTRTGLLCDQRCGADRRRDPRRRHPRYVLIGPAQQVFAWVDEKKKYGRVERVPTYEQAAVHQLLGSRHLRIGGTHLVSYSGREGPANSVLVPRTSRAMVTRWGNYRPLR